jgi:N-acyl-D-amino-acid deacylase
VQAENNVDVDAMKAILNFPNALIGLSDGGAHVQFNGGYGFSTRLLGEWVREKGIMGLEQAVRRLTLDSASTFGLYDRGLLRPGMAADITIFDPDTVKPLPEFIVHDLPAGGWRFKEPAAGIYATFVNGKMLMKEGEHTGNLPGRVLRNSHYQANHG